jgi:hypothetical protein
MLPPLIPVRPGSQQAILANERFAMSQVGVKKKKLAVFVKNACQLSKGPNQTDPCSSVFNEADYSIEHFLRHVDSTASMPAYQAATTVVYPANRRPVVERALVGIPYTDSVVNNGKNPH